MAKSFIESVKLPHLVAVQHPLKKFSNNCSLNIQGKNPNEINVSNMDSFDRKNYIINLLDRDDVRSRSSVNKINTSSDQVIDLIDQKLNTGYYGVKHLFLSNDIHKNGRLSRESFRWILNQLCGYISNEAWNKIVQKFNLNENETISFDEFISYFESNQNSNRSQIMLKKVKKEIHNKNKELLDLKSSSMTTLLSKRDLSKKIPLPELSAAYCLSIIRLKASKKNFDVKKFLPEECFFKNLVLPHHLQQLLNTFELKLSSKEFQKLWNKFDINNNGCCRISIFLKLINYKPAEENQNNYNLYHSQSFVVDKLDLNSNLISSNQPLVPFNTSRSNLMTNEKYNIADEASLVSKTICETLDEIKEIEEEKNQNEDGLQKEKIEPKPIIEAQKMVQSVPRSNTSLSEAKMKSMANSFKKMSDFGPNNDLVSFLNNNLNEGAILLRTAFEFIDQDQIGHLLAFEFGSVLEEFKLFSGAKLMKKFLKKHFLLKSDQLVDYVKFLNIFNDRSPYSLFKQQTNYGQSIDNTTCSLEQFKKLIEQKFSIIIDENQFKTLLDFLNVDCQGQTIKWEVLFARFSELDAWKLFKDSYERSESKSRKSFASNRSGFNRSKSLLNFNNRSEAFDELKEKTILEENSDNHVNVSSSKDFQVSSDDEVLSSMITFKTKKKLKYSKYSELSKNFQEEAKLIRNLEKKVETTLRSKFHSVNKFFSVLDKTHKEMINKEKFQNLMKKCGTCFDQEEINLLWKDFDVDYVPFSLFVRRFFKPDEFDNYRHVRHRINMEKQIKDDQINKKLLIEPSNSGLKSIKEKDDETKLSKDKFSNKQIDSLIVKKWDELKQEFRREDKLGKTLISLSKAYNILQTHKIVSDEEELHELNHKFIINGIYFNYVKFLRYFKKRKNDDDLSNINPILINLIAKLREKTFQNKRTIRLNENDIQNLQIILKKYDKSKKGYLTQKEFKSVFDSFGIKPSSDQIYMMMSEFDPNLQGIFDYERLVHSLIEKLLV